MLSRQDFYTRFDPYPDDGTSCFTAGQANSDRCSQSWENSVAFLMALGQFLIIAFVFNKGPPHRKPLYTNTGLLLGERGDAALACWATLSVGALACCCALCLELHTCTSPRSLLCSAWD